jgi:transporter family protein
MLLSMNLIGLARAAVMSQTVLIWSSAMAVGFLGERMTPRVALGTLAIMFGAILLVYKDHSATRKRTPLRYYLVPALSAFGYACAHLTGKYAFSWIPSSAFGMAAANTTSLALVLSMMPFTKETGLARWDWRGLSALLVGSVIQAFGILFFWSAVKLGEVTQVIPLSRLSLLLIIFLSWLLFRQQESVTWRVVAGGVLALAGAFAVAG